MTDPLPFSTITGLIHNQAARYDRHLAFSTDAGDCCSYRELAESYDTMAATLRRSGIRPTDRVVVVMPNGLSMAVTLLSVIGHACCAPLNTDYTNAEFRFFIKNLKPAAIILADNVESILADLSAELRLPVLRIQHSDKGPMMLDSPTAITAEDGENVEDNKSESLVLHTSGTTSRPKIVPLTERGLLYSACNMARWLSLTKEDRCLNVMPLFHIHGIVAGLLATLVSGGRIHCTAGFEINKFFTQLAFSQASWYSAVPTMHQAVVDRGSERSGSSLGHCLRFIRSASAALPAIVMSRLESLFEVPVLEAYGMTEACTLMTCNPLPPGVCKPGSVGLPVATEIVIRREDDLANLPGLPGRIVIKGNHVMDGYCDNPEANRSSFEDGFFDTGDLGYFDEDGYLFITGRHKEIINRGGEKVSPREVDDMLLQHPGVRQAVTFANPHPALGEDVVAAVVLRSDSECHASVLREYLFTRLADFKVPSQIIFLPTIPLGATGKIQRIGLAEQLAEQIQPVMEDPVSAIELLLASLFEDVLNKESIGRQHNFFSLGGDSLSGARLIQHINDMVRTELAITEIFRNPTVAELAVLVENSIRDEFRERLNDIVNKLMK